ncbi:MAG: class I SAM-dependent methyltransferase [Candidatus Portnoybacteria bacterium]|nr:class I SAM-dependent methyltransferase [Candidatus Portnoybacteria bacterium]
MQNDFYEKKEYKINRFRKKAILEMLGSAEEILDIGCAGGELGEIIKKEKGAAVFGIEISQDAAQRAGQKLDQVFRFDVSRSFEEWPAALKGLKFNGIVISEVLEHLFYPEDLLDKIKAIMAPGAELIITVPNFLFWKNRLKIFFGNFEYHSEGLLDRGHIHFFTWQSLERLIGDCGFRILKTRHHIPTRGAKLFGRIFPGLFAYQFIVKAILK